jgi:hypothetical protein
VDVCWLVSGSKAPKGNENCDRTTSTMKADVCTFAFVTILATGKATHTPFYSLKCTETRRKIVSH